MKTHLGYKHGENTDRPLPDFLLPQPDDGIIKIQSNHIQVVKLYIIDCVEKFKTPDVWTFELQEVCLEPGGQFSDTTKYSNYSYIACSARLSSAERF